ncbi:hypothetical protein NEFER01_0824 [Nematocida sp. LUAm1]|nr:hypothetical protein NEFER02_0928 [Nematocida sp. LUAm2]KAI5177574.1 hypothetical protein NEFER01_0824 [Nematocida sp. LUAm1]
MQIETYKENQIDHTTEKINEGYQGKSLSLKGQGLTNEWWKLVGYMPTVEILLLDENLFSELPESILKKKFPKLRVVSLKKNKIQRISAEALFHPLLEIADFEGNTSLTELFVSEAYEEQEKSEEGAPSLRILNLLETSVNSIEKEFFRWIPDIKWLFMHVEHMCGGCGFDFLSILENLQHLKLTGVKTGSCSVCTPEKGSSGFSTAVQFAIYNMVCKMTSLVEIDLSGKDMNIDYFVFLTPLPHLESLRIQGRLVRDMSLRDWPGILKTIKHLSLGVIDGSEESSEVKKLGESTFYTEKILEATSLESLSFDSETSRKIKFSLGTKKVIFPYLRHLTIKNCDLRPLTFFNKENAPLLTSLEIISSSFTEGYFYTIKKRLGNRLTSLRIGIEKMDAPQAIYDLFTFIRSHSELECLHLSVCDTITESQSFYKYFSDRPTLKELCIVGKMNIHRMKRFLYQLGHCSSLSHVLLDIEEPSAVMSYFYPIFSLSFFSLKSTYAEDPKAPIPPKRSDLEKLAAMSNLQSLDLSGCGLTQFPTLILQNLSNLSHLYLNNNRISELDEALLEILREKKDNPLYIDLSDNLIRKGYIINALIKCSWLGESGFIIF